MCSTRAWSSSAGRRLRFRWLACLTTFAPRSSVVTPCQCLTQTEQELPLFATKAARNTGIKLLIVAQPRQRLVEFKFDRCRLFGLNDGRRFQECG